MHAGGTLAAHEITIHRGADAILERVSLTVTQRSRIGVVGPNGRGKTTLLRALAGLEPLDGGALTRNPPSLRVGYLPQEHDLAAGETPPLLSRAPDGDRRGRGGAGPARGRARA